MAALLDHCRRAIIDLVRHEGGNIAPATASSYDRVDELYYEITSKKISAVERTRIAN